MPITPLAALLADLTRTLLDAGHTPAVTAVAVRGPEQAVATAGPRTDPSRTREAAGPHTHPQSAPKAAGPRTLFALGSITKTFTTLLLAEMAAQGVVDYEDPIGAHLPPWAVPRRATPPITLAHLATHSAGMPRLPPGLHRRALPFSLSDPYARYDAEALHRATARLRPPPDTPAAVYSTYGIGLLGHLISRAAGLPYAVLLTERILSPLGMRDTCVPTDDILRRHAAQGHRHGRPVPHWHFDSLAGAGALYSTGDDMLRYLRAHLHPATAPAPLTIAITDACRPRHAYARGANHISLGWNVRTVRGHTLLWHSGGTGGFTAFLGFSPDAEAGVALLANTAPALRQPILRAARRLFRTVVYG